jgi:hypothetical protein
LATRPGSQLGTAAARTGPAGESLCSECGASNPAGAEWCGQCLRRFAPEPPQPPWPQQPPGPPQRPGPRRASRGPFEVTGDVVTWTCAVCHSDNQLAFSECAACGAPLAATLRPPVERRGRDPGTAALLSLFAPGAGHAYVGSWGHAAARAVTILWVGCVALIFAVEHGVLGPLSLLFEAAAGGLWLIAAHDAYREAQGDSGAVLLRGHTHMWVFVGLVLASVVATLVSATAAV